MSMGTAASESTVAELHRLELMLMDPAVRRDREQVARLLAEDFVEFGSSGCVWTREMTLDGLETDTYSPPVVECFECKMLGGDAALVAYRAVRTKEATGEGTVTLRSSIWTRVSGDWKLRFHQGTRTGAGFE
jgi:hypothetical protein